VDVDVTLIPEQIIIIILGEKMKSLVFIVLIVVAAIFGYSIVNKPAEAPVVEVSEEMPAEVAVTDTGSESETISMITPADMPEEAQTEMYAKIMDYNKCMMQNRLEYHQQGVRAESVADKTLAACEPHLDELALVLETNNVNDDLSKGMVKTMRQRAARKLMSAVMTSLAGQAAAAANATPAPTTAPATTPTETVTP
jgi:hypothetical protein